MRTLADVNLWLATLHLEHPHHERAIEWWRETAEAGRGPVLFCRVTQLGLLRLLGNEHVMGPSRRTPEQAWNDYHALLAQPPIEYAEEPDRLEGVFVQVSTGRSPSPGLWADAYLAAFAIAGGLELVTFDRGFRRFPGLRLDLLS